MSQEKQTRLQKYISEAGAASRRHAEELIAQGKVRVNGRAAKIGDKIDPFRDLVSVEGVNLPRKSRKQQYRYLAVHKPRGFVTTMEDELGRKCIRELTKGLPERVYPVGRLDKESEGLVLSLIHIYKDSALTAQRTGAGSRRPLLRGVFFFRPKPFFTFCNRPRPRFNLDL